VELAPPAALEDFLHRHGVEASIERVPGKAPTSRAAADLLGVPVRAIAKTLVLHGDGTWVAAVLQGDRRLDLLRLSRALGISGLRMARAHEVREQTGYPPGGVAPVAFLRQPRVVIDTALHEGRTGAVIAGGGREDLVLRIRVEDIVRLNHALVAPISEE
jgi:prolyl-tRNA editing enzyme YbaK/EbsC (Cys-tRNA(Pro) deacylase)